MEASRGGFAPTLRAAIDRSGLTLDRIGERLRRVGTPVTVATLSYWQSGRSRPERETSLQAIPHLEQILGLPTGRLQETLPPGHRRTRSRIGSLDSIWPSAAQGRALGRLDTSQDAHLERVNVHDRLRISPDGRWVSQWVHQVLRARADGPDRRIIMHGQDDLSAPLPRLRIGDGATLGRTVRDPGSGVFATELMFGRALQRGDTVTMTYQLDWPAIGPRDQSIHRRMRGGLRQYLLEVEFTDQLPDRVETLGDLPDRSCMVDFDGRVHLLVENSRPGSQFGLRWVWSPPAGPA